MMTHFLIVGIWFEVDLLPSQARCTSPEIHKPWFHSCGLNFIEFPYLQLFCLTPTRCVSSVSHECSLLIIIPLMIFQQFHLLLCPLSYLLHQSEIDVCFLCSKLFVNQTFSDWTLWVSTDPSFEPFWDW